MSSTRLAEKSCVPLEVKLIHGENFLFHAQNHAIPFSFLARPRSLALSHVLRVPSLSSTGHQGRIGTSRRKASLHKGFPGHWPEKKVLPLGKILCTEQPENTSNRTKHGSSKKTQIMKDVPQGSCQARPLWKK
ncbi:unnamed protein product [Arctogadus glacialis]